MLQHRNSVPKLPNRVVVIGAGGFIASEIVSAVVGCGVEVLKLGRPSLDLLQSKSVRLLKSVLQPGDSVVFAAAHAPVRNLEMFQSNIIMLENLVEALVDVNVSHLVYLSSDAVYSDSRNLLSEKSSTGPSSMHGAMHLTREIVLRDLLGDRLAIVRPTLVYGSRDPHNGYGPNRFVRSARANGEIQIFGSGEEYRDHISVNDVAEIINQILQMKSAGVINAVTGDPVTFRDIADAISEDIADVVKVVSLPRFGPMPHDGYRAFDVSLLREKFPTIELMGWRDGMRHLVSA